MRIACVALLSLFFMSFTSDWNTRFDKAKEKALQEHKYILLNFSGSDWCGPCIRLHKEFFDNDAFTKLAEEKLVLVNADFPRQKKNQLAKDLQKQNDQLAEQYDKTGAFPFTVLLDEKGNVVKTWEGVPKEKPEEFTTEISAAINASK